MVLEKLQEAVGRGPVMESSGILLEVGNSVRSEGMWCRHRREMVAV